MAMKKGGKACPSCGKIVGARSTTCKFCKTAIPMKKGKGLDLDRAVKVVQEMGGLKALSKNLADYEKVASPIDRLGGIIAAKAILERLEAIKAL